MAGRSKKRIRLAIVDDSAFVRKVLMRVLGDEPMIVVVGAAASGEELLANLDRWRPDAVTLDLSMPGLGGIATLDRIMQWRRIPVVILSTQSTRDAPMTVEALHHGAIDFIDKGQISMVDFQALRETLVAKLLEGTPHPEIGAASESVATEAMPAFAETTYSLLLIGASTGGPPAIQQLLEDIGAPLPVPTCIVQHMPLGFTKAFAERLNAHLPMTVTEAGHGEGLAAGRVYIAPSGMHLRVRCDDDNLTAVLSHRSEGMAHCPSVDVMFASAVEIAKRTIAVLLTGMGNDGARGMRELRDAGALTIAQNESSSIIYGMPRAAHDLGGVAEQLHINRIGERVRQLIRGKV